MQDIWDKYIINQESNYYIGTLVVDEKDTSNCEIIDGQQRHTTITLINAYLFRTEESKFTVHKSNLQFDARKEVEEYIQSLFQKNFPVKNVDKETPSLNSFHTAFKVINEFLSAKKEKESIEAYYKYFYQNVKIIRIAVPTETDINHYFEVMNNRGEQFEKHEILKAKFISSIIDKKLAFRFATIWDACSQMDKYIQSATPPEIRKVIFNDDYNKIPDNILWIDFLTKVSDSGSEKDASNNDDLDTIKGIIENHPSPDNENKNEVNIYEGKYKSIIDFPNFLLLVLKLDNNNVSLDDKFLLDEFGYTNKIDGRTMPKPCEFINKLFLYRILFDRYIIKREEGSKDWSWSILKPYLNTNNQLDYRNTFDKDKEVIGESEEIIMLQSMLHVSFPSNSYKNWLYELFLNLDLSISKDTILEKLKSTASTLFNNEAFSKDKTIGYPSISRFVFNYTDYLLWSVYNEEVKGITNTFKEEGLIKRIVDNKAKFSAFRFTQNNSIEHVSPQHPHDGSTAIDGVNRFGNLCLVSSSSNSRFGNLNFASKKEFLENNRQIESLKQVIIFSYTQ